MGKRFTRIRYGPPENYSDEDRIGYGEAVSMITDLLGPTYSRRQIENHVRYATRIEKLTRATDGSFKFSDIARSILPNRSTPSILVLVFGIG